MPRISHRLSPKRVAKRPPHRFPVSGRFVIYSTPSFLISVKGQQELVACPSKMIIETGPVKKLSNGSRRVPLILHEWAAVGKSRLLGGELRHTMVKTIQAHVHSGSTVADLPGKMTIRLAFDTFFNGERVQKARIGQAVGLISSFPPKKGDLFDLSSKTFKVGPVNVRGLMCACASAS